MNRQPVTLRQNDSINLTTGQVTRSLHSHPANRAPLHPLEGLREGLRANDLITLDTAFRIMLVSSADKSIPSLCVWCSTPTTRIIGMVPGVSVGNPECGC